MQFKRTILVCYVASSSYITLDSLDPDQIDPFTDHFYAVQKRYQTDFVALKLRNLR